MIKKTKTITIGILIGTIEIAKVSRVAKIAKLI